jgi:branched-chain amino acid transport system permease protein
MGLDTILTHTMGIQMTIKAFAAVILGGLGSVQGAVAGGFLLGIGENIGVWFLPSVWKDSIAFGIMTIGLYLKPTGLFGKAGEAMVLGK